MRHPIHDTVASPPSPPKSGVSLQHWFTGLRLVDRIVFSSDNTVTGKPPTGDKPPPTQFWKS
jgi:hypothetical protein